MPTSIGIDRSHSTAAGLLRPLPFSLSSQASRFALLIKLPVGQGVFSALDGYSGKRLLYLLFDELADRGIWREIAALAIQTPAGFGSAPAPGECRAPVCQLPPARAPVRADG
ncbi:hypothetical protein [Paenibacillus larvae]|uniref:hypothetical protein n=1 Tax=Paenibacillus larvae TaxID=1464 RepID=UPI00288FFD05|nr:hypothetical protein [Paenibacillus larvae]MDT2194474.1 hypothetical protein [Paenibacillus larvae]